MFESEYLVVAAAHQQSANWTEPPLKTTWLALGPLTVMKPKMDTWVSGLEGVEGGKDFKGKLRVYSEPKMVLDFLFCFVIFLVVKPCL